MLAGSVPAAWRPRTPPRWGHVRLLWSALVDWNAGIGRQLGRLFGADAEEPRARPTTELEPRVQRARPGPRGHDATPPVLAEIADDEGTALPGRAPPCSGRSLPDFARVPRGARRADLRSRPRLAPGGADQQRPRPHRGVDAGHRRALRRRRFFFLDRLLQAAATARLLRDLRGRPPPRPRRPEPLPRRRAGRRARDPVGLDQPVANTPTPPPTRERGDLNGLADVLDELVA